MIDFAEQRVRADDDVDRAVFRPSFTSRQLLGADEARGLRDADRQALEALDEGLEVLAREQRRRQTTATCLPLMAATKAARSATSVLPKPTSPQTSRSIGCPAPRSVSTASMRVLVVGLLVREAGDELVVGAFGRRQSRAPPAAARSAAILISSPAISRIRSFSRALRDCQAVAAEPVELRARLVRAVARQQLDILDRHEELVAARIFELDAVVRSAEHGDGLRPSKRPMPWSAWTTRSPTERLVASVRTSAALRRLRRGRTSRSPSMSCSVRTASSGVSKPCSRPSTASAVVSPASARASA